MASSKALDSNMALVCQQFGIFEVVGLKQNAFLWLIQQGGCAEFKRWTEAGIRVFLYDCHSFGRSEPLDEGHRSLVVNHEHLVDDVYTFRKARLLLSFVLRIC